MDKKVYIEQALEKYITLFNWKSDSLKLPLNPEFWLTTNGSIGYLIDRDMWVIGQFNGILDKYGDFKEYVWHSLNTNDVETGTAENHGEIIVCGNTPLYRPFEKERDWFAQMKSEIDKSIEVLNTNTRKYKGFVVENDRKKKELERVLKAADDGKPVIFTTTILEEQETVDLTDPADIEKMQYLNSFYQAIEKRENNFAGIDLDLIQLAGRIHDLRVQVRKCFFQADGKVLHNRNFLSRRGCISPGFIRIIIPHRGGFGKSIRRFFFIYRLLFFVCVRFVFAK